MLRSVIQLLLKILPNCVICIDVSARRNDTAAQIKFTRMVYQHATGADSRASRRTSVVCAGRYHLLISVTLTKGSEIAKFNTKHIRFLIFIAVGAKYIHRGVV